MSSALGTPAKNRIWSGRFPRLVASAASVLIASGIATTGDVGANRTAGDAGQPPYSYYRSSEESSRAVLIALGANESEEAWTPIADSLRQSGFHVLVMDPVVVEESAASRTTRRGEYDGRSARTGPSPMDAQAALCYLLDLPGLTVSEVALLGSGSGCSAVAEIHEIGSERFSLVLLSPRGDWRDWTDGLPAGLRGCPLLVIAATDDLLSIEASAAILREAPQQECWIVDGRGRGVEILGSRPDLVSHVIAWITRSIGAAGEEP